MAMTRKKRRIMLIGIGAGFLAAASVLVGIGFSDAIELFRSPTQIAEEPPRPGDPIQVGGLVKEGSLVRGDGAEIRFVVTDGNADQLVVYKGVLPDLFREGQGTIAKGTLNPEGVFVAREVLAKHDEKYMPREVVDALKEQGVYKEPESGS
ncbi:cytochrome c maturation protein CcmE [Rhodovulum sp. DZ06]|uniref:cytochrome c maturation protein CcmE n=1 Tax=Rhodovulum sp. DZ06 TaxID=3425126 RepID=UPI003D32FA34